MGFQVPVQRVSEFWPYGARVLGRSKTKAFLTKAHSPPLKL